MAKRITSLAKASDNQLNEAWNQLYHKLRNQHYRIRKSLGTRKYLKSYAYKRARELGLVKAWKGKRNLPSFSSLSKADKRKMLMKIARYSNEEGTTLSSIKTGLNETKKLFKKMVYQPSLEEEMEGDISYKDVTRSWDSVYFSMLEKYPYVSRMLKSRKDLYTLRQDKVDRIRSSCKSVEDYFFKLQNLLGSLENETTYEGFLTKLQ